MQADTLLPEHQRRYYRGVVDAFLRISREDGFLGLYRGVGPNIARAMALNCGMLASNDQVSYPSLPLRSPISHNTLRTTADAATPGLVPMLCGGRGDLYTANAHHGSRSHPVMQSANSCT